ncbi:MAG: TSUP family transporter [Minisyncoccota bacterium]
MIHIFEAVIFIIYSFLAPIITAGGSIIVTNILSLANINLIKATGLTSSYFLVNAVLVVYIFRKDIVWREVKNLLPITILGSFLGALFLVNIKPTILLSLMFVFSVYFIYKKIHIIETKTLTRDSFLKEQWVGLFAGSITGAALPGGGFLNSYFASKGFTLSQMFGTLSFIIQFVFAVKIAVMLHAGILKPSDFWGIAIAFPFLIVSNILLRKGLLKLSKSATNKITIFAMSFFSVYALVVILTSII